MSNSGRVFTAWLVELGIAVAIVAGTATVNAQKPIAVPMPPMGWSSWNSFSNTVDSQVIVDQAKAMISTGMHKAGYQNINIDEGWWLGKRDERGNIVVDPNAWPALAPGERAGDMSNIVRYIHSLGLKAGIYTDAGRDGCGTFFPDLGAGYPGEGSEGHYEQDFLQFAKWGFDYVKVDWCGGDKENLAPALQYAEIARAIKKAGAITGHNLYYSICEWGKQSPWSWAPNVGGSPADIWRTSGDIVDPIVANSKNSGRRASFKKVLSNFDQGVHPEAQHTGFYNDPDMMVIGMPGLTDAENRAHMSLWAVSGAPLLVGADLTQLGDATLATLTNPAVLAIDQDALGLQAVKAHEEAGGLEVWSKRLARPGERAVLVVNRAEAGASAVVSPVTIFWKDLGLAGSEASVRDPWTGKDLGTFGELYRASVNQGDAVLLLIRGTEARAARISSLPAAKSTAGGNSVTADEQTFIVKPSVCAQPAAAIEINYTNPDSTPRMAELRVNGQNPTRILFPPTGAAAGSIWIQALLDKSGEKISENNRLNFSTPVGAAPQIEFISVHPNKLCAGDSPAKP